MKHNIKIAILGGGGKAGKYLVTQLMNQGYGVKALLRHPENFEFDNPLIEIIKGDALDASAIDTVIEGCRAVISTIGQRKDEPLVASQATVNVLKSMAKHGIERYLLVAGINLDTPFDKKGPETSAATAWMKANFPVICEDIQEAYSILSASEVNWTLVRVPLIELTDERGEIIVDLEDCKGSKISASDIAAFLIEQLSDHQYFKKSPFITNP
jgi:putative NADH-flavin reductase